MLRNRSVRRRDSVIEEIIVLIAFPWQDGEQFILSQAIQFLSRIDRKHRIYEKEHARKYFSFLHCPQKRKLSFLDEIEIMKKAKHRNIVRIWDTFEEKRSIHLIIDYCEGGDMLEYIQKNGVYENEKARSVFKQLIDAVEYLHKLDIAHRDLKPENILISLPISWFIKKICQKVLFF